MYVPDELSFHLVFRIFLGLQHLYTVKLTHLNHLLGPDMQYVAPLSYLPGIINASAKSKTRTRPHHRQTRIIKNENTLKL